jgi:hypothetical protein
MGITACKEPPKSLHRKKLSKFEKKTQQSVERAAPFFEESSLFFYRRKPFAVFGNLRRPYENLLNFRSFLFLFWGHNLQQPPTKNVRVTDRRRRGANRAHPRANSEVGESPWSDG